MRRGLIAALVAAAMLAGCGGGGATESSQAGAPRAFYGVISAEPLPGAAELARMGRGRVGTLRINLAWGSVQSSPGAPYDWSHYDPVIAGAARNGIRVLATVYSSPTWAEPSPEYPPLGNRMAQFQDFVRAAVGRYGTRGTFWREHPDVPRLPVTDWQVWNEPNSPLFWKPKPDPAAYLELLRGFDSAARGADPQAQIVLGGLFPTPRGGLTMRDFMTALYRDRAQNLFDAAAIHPYAANPEDALASTAELRGVMDRSGDADGRIWISEVGWASGGRPSGLTVGAQEQADVPHPDLRARRSGPRAARAGRRDLVLAERHPRPALARPLRALRAERLCEAGMGHVYEPHWRQGVDHRTRAVKPSSSHRSSSRRQPIQEQMDDGLGRRFETSLLPWAVGLEVDR